MTCIICYGEDIRPSDVCEEIAVGPDSVRVPVTVLVCRTCGERYSDRATMRKLERDREDIVRGHSPLAVVGKVLQVD